jgi:hypothetical protein
MIYKSKDGVITLCECKRVIWVEYIDNLTAGCLNIHRTVTEICSIVFRVTF